MTSMQLQTVAMEGKKAWVGPNRGQPVQEHETELDTEKKRHVTTKGEDGKQTIVM